MIRGGSKLEAKLKEIGEKVAAGTMVRVGFLEGATYPDGTKFALVAAIQNFGAPARGIPPRPFFTNMVSAKAHEWGPALANVLKARDYDAPSSLLLLGDAIKGQLEQSIRDTNAPPLADATIERKGFAKPLIDTAHMFDSIGVEVRG